MNFKLEICVDNIESAIAAQDAGADRIELCTDLPEGGTTPGYGTIMVIRKRLSIGLHVIIRPRGGDFLYSDCEYDIMKKDIEICGECGADGVVLGILDRGGSIDVDRTARLIELAKPMSATFHRAFDMCSDPFKGLEDVIDTGADRLLTSGQKNKAEENPDLIKRLVIKAAARIIIMPGSGIGISNIGNIARYTGASEFHLTGRKEIDSKMKFRRPEINMGSTSGVSEYSRKVVDAGLIRNIVACLKMI